MVRDRERCEVYLREDGLYAFAQIEWQPGLWLPLDHVSRMQLEDSAETIGTRVRELLTASRNDPVPATPRSATSRVLKLLGFRGWKAFAGQARALSVVRTGAEVIVIPSIARGSGLFSYVHEQRSTGPDDAAGIGHRIQRHFSEPDPA